MAYDASGLSAVSYANGFTLWHYRTADTVAEVDGVGYFDEAVKMLRVGDFMFVNTGIFSSRSDGVLVVAANDGESVDTSNVVAFGTINSD